MSSFYDNENLDWCENTRDWVIKKCNNRIFHINKKKLKFNWENIEGQFDDEFDEFDIGISKKSAKVSAADEPFNDYQHKVNRGENSYKWRTRDIIDIELIDLDDLIWR